MNVAYLINSKDGKPQSLSCMIDGRLHSISNSHGNFKMVLGELGKTVHDIGKLKKLMDIGGAIVEYSWGKIDVQKGRVYFRGKEIHNSLTRRIVEFMRADVPCDRLIRFFQNLQANPNARSREQLYNYCENYKMPFTEDGCFLAYKAVRNDFTDKWTGKIDNHPGKSPKMSRNQCDENENHACAPGLHCGDFSYVQGYGNLAANDRYILIKVNPRNVVACPLDCSWKKIRTCGYLVLQEVKRDDVVEFKTECAEKVPYYNVRDSKGHFTKAIQARKAVSKVRRDKMGRFV